MEPTIAATPEPPPDFFSNETPGTADTAPKTPFTERVKQAGARIFEKHGLRFKKGPGRPKKDGTPGVADIPLNAPSTALPVNSAPVAPSDVPPVDVGLLKRCVKSVVKGVTGWLDKMLFRRALERFGNAKEAQDLVADTSATAEEVDSFSELGAYCLKKYGLTDKYALETGLIATAAGIGVRYALAFKATAPPKTPATSAPPPPNVTQL